jgi:hypothetical protein
MKIGYVNALLVVTGEIEELPAELLGTAYLFPKAN